MAYAQLLFGYLKEEKRENSNEKFFREDRLKSFFLIKLHMTERLETLNEVCEGMARLKNHITYG